MLVAVWLEFHVVVRLGKTAWSFADVFGTSQPTLPQGQHRRTRRGALVLNLIDLLLFAVQTTSSIKQALTESNLEEWNRLVNDESSTAHKHWTWLHDFLLQSVFRCQDLDCLEREPGSHIFSFALW